MTTKNNKDFKTWLLVNVRYIKAKTHLTTKTTKIIYYIRQINIYTLIHTYITHIHVRARTHVREANIVVKGGT